MTIFDRAIFTDLEDVPGQGTLFPQVAKLSEQFFQQLADHPVPLEEAAVRAISNNSMALDLYAWLAYRLHVLKVPTPVELDGPQRTSSPGAGFNSMRHFPPKFPRQFAASTGRVSKRQGRGNRARRRPVPVFVRRWRLDR